METYKYNSYTISIHYDDHSIDSPLDWTSPEDRGATFVLYRKGQNLPCEVDIDFDDYNSWESIISAVAKGKKYKYVNWYEHSGVSVTLQDSSTPSDRWDAGIAGFVFGDDLELIESNFNEWKAYIEGDIFGFKIENADKEIVEEYCGYYGIESAKESAEAEVDYIVRALEESELQNVS